jgi:Trypsin
LSNVKVRLGDWDFRNSNEQLPDQEFDIATITIHPEYDSQTMKNNIAIVRLATPVNLGELPTIGTSCLPCK